MQVEKTEPIEHQQCETRMTQFQRLMAIAFVIMGLQPFSLIADEPGNAPRRLALLDSDTTFGGGATVAGLKPIGSVTVDISAPAGRQPIQKPLPQVADHTRESVATTFLWKPTHLSHPPLLFEEYNLERHGHSFGALQPAVSGLHFFGSIPLIPYRCVAEGKCNYEVGHIRPGSCAPFVVQVPDLKTKPTLAEAAAVTATLLLVP